MLLFNNFPIDIQEKILHFLFKEYNYESFIIISELKFYIYKLNYKNNILNENESFYNYFFNLYKEYNYLYNDSFIESSDFYIDYGICYNICNFCNTKNHLFKFKINNYDNYNPFPTFRKLKNYEKVLTKKIIRNYCNLTQINKIKICNGCYFGYSKNKNTKFFIHY